MGPAGPWLADARGQGAVVMATVTTVAEALEVEAGGVDVVIVQGGEAGGHRSTFRPGAPDRWPLIGTMALVLAFVTAYLADAAGSALIIGAFAAGLILAPTPQAKSIQRGVVGLGQFFVPIFFVSVGAAVEVQSFLQPGVLAIGLTLIAVAIIGKVAAGYAPVWFKGKKSVIGVGVVPRGEVGLIFAQMGLAAAAVDGGQYSALLLMVMGTTFFAPPVLRALLGKDAGPPAAGRVAPGSEQMVVEA